MMIQETYYLEYPVIETVDIINGGFESWSSRQQPEGWNIDELRLFYRNHYNVHSGEYSCSIGGSGQMWQECDVTPGETYTLTVYKRTNTGSLSKGRVDVYNVTDSGKTTNVSKLLLSDTNWEQFNLSFKVPDNVDRIEIRFTGDSASVINVDDVSCVLTQ